MPIMQFVGNLGYVMVALLGGVFVIKKSIEVGDIQSFFQYIRNNTDRCIYYDAFHQCVDDSGGTSDPAGFHVHHPDCHEAFPEILPGSAELSG